jgi:two-component system, response regulator
MPDDTVEILLVEDNDNDVELALHALRKSGLANRIHVSRDGEEALDFIFCRGLYSARSFNRFVRLIVLDLTLPKVGAMEVLRQLKSDPRTRAIPVIVLTGSNEAIDTTAGYELGINGYIQKPMDFAKFRETVNELGMCWVLVNQRPAHLAPLTTD